MKTERILYLFLISFFTLTAAHADVYETLATGSLTYEDPTSWVGGVVPPNPIAADDVVIIHGAMTIGPGSFTSHGTFIVEETATLTFLADTSFGYVFFNLGLVIINGTMFSHEKEGTFNQVLNFGVFDLNGFWENSTLFDNTGTTLVQDGALFRNWEATDTGCKAGFIINNVQIFRQGGMIDSSDCAGGMVLGGPPVNGFCGEPHAVIAYVDNNDDFHLRWTKRPFSSGYRVGVQFAGVRRLRDVSAATNEIVVPDGDYPTGASLDYGAHTFCSPGVFFPAHLTLSESPVMTRQALAKEPIGEIVAYQNPASSNLTVYIPDFDQAETYFLEIIEPSGRKVISSQGYRPVVSMDLSELKAGAYFLTVRSATSQRSQLVVVE